MIRKKPTGRTGKRIEEARATFGTIDADSGPDFMGPSNTPWITPRGQQAHLSSQERITGSLAPQNSTETRLAEAELSGQVVAHLLGRE